MIENTGTPISATEARVHFGEVLQRVAQGETLVVERGGRAVAVIPSVEEYERLRKAPKQQEILDALWRPGQEIRSHLQGPISSPEEVIRAMREERTLELGGS
ncbi:type II toxin-antitoxin system Phd/YefM family antitoxin [Thermus scotoductus]|uniref:Antitoxin n=1 Tax=Thermus scotoductus TaxID=37636 RepID=A0A430R1Z3_THESC|nr:type II toxin-antitoxin system prevent-host-death family antitoxin [Thermus scotoductus]RTG93351.1 addiction module antitoxin [Thermus scotoductus]RTH01384.1 addiction module antitoxin [Thermus scotoductus]RTH15693.1 addiction module antitoxin [Thermus scotoductus]RTH97932.1 addiction module antitoxin [Thermus scotoductus]RTI23439.1 addiction module antitoxin [Thermus scotoductus]